MLMIKCATGILILLSFHKQVSNGKAPVNINQRIELLKKQIMDEIHNDAIRHVTKPNEKQKLNLNDNYDHLVTDADDDLIKPITEYIGSKKKKHKSKFRTKDKKMHKNASTINQTTETEPTTLKPKLFSKIMPSDVYRKMFHDDEERNKPQKWTHCLDLVTPYLKGLKEKMTMKTVTHKDHTVRRLASLLSLNTTGYPKEDIVSILYQISNLKLRLFQWDLDAILTIFNVIIPQRVHNFRTLKYGLKAIFKKWHLDTSNTTALMQQSKIFRPPCIAVSEFGGSTKSSRYERYTTPSANKKSDSDCSY